MTFSLSRLSAICALLAPLVIAQGSNRQLLTNVTVFDPPDNYTVPRTLYARVRKLSCDGDNTLLATWENYLPTENNTTACPSNCPLNPYIPIWESTDLGETWSERSRVYDTQNGWGLRYQPDLYEMTEEIGNYSAGTLLMAANSIPADLSETKIDVYASTDKGYVFPYQVYHQSPPLLTLPLTATTGTSSPPSPEAATPSPKTNTSPSGSPSC
jgi:hypothetical protein